MIHHMPLADFLATYRPAGTDATWEDAFTALNEEPDTTLIDELAQEYLHHGRFIHPIRVTAGGCDPEDVAAEECTGTPDCCPPSVLNGMHRITALTRLRVPEVAYTDTPPTLEDDSPTLYVTLRDITDHTGIMQEGNPFPLFSFRVSEHIWCETDVITGIIDDISMYVDSIPPAELDVFRRALLARLDQFGISVGQIETEWVEFDEDGQELAPRRKFPADHRVGVAQHRQARHRRGVGQEQRQVAGVLRPRVTIQPHVGCPAPAGRPTPATLVACGRATGCGAVW